MNPSGRFILPRSARTYGGARPVGLEQLASPDDMARLCRGFARYYDDVIVDSPAGIGPGFETAAAAAQAFLWSLPRYGLRP